MLTGIILAGGDHGRMRGEQKALLPVGGELLIQKQIREMSQIADEMMIVTDQPRPFLRAVDPSVRIITDFISGRGPLGGMHAGLSLMTGEVAWIVACDMPFLSAAAPKYMLQFMDDFGFEAVVPKIGGRIEMLHGIYKKHVGDSARLLLQTGDQRPQQLLHFLRWSEVDSDQFVASGIETNFTTAIKTREDLAKIQQMIGEPAVQ